MQVEGQVVVEVEQFRMGPRIGRIHCHVDRQIAQHLNPGVGGDRVQPVPLPVELPLHPMLVGQFIGILVAETVERAPGGCGGRNSGGKHLLIADAAVA